MKKNEWRKKFIFFLFFISFLIIILPFFEIKEKGVEAESPFLFSEQNYSPQLIIFQESSLFPLNNPSQFIEKKVVRRLNVLITAYSSTPEQTDDTPHLTASGSRVREGVVANNFLPFGTKIKIPELYGDKIFIVEDRMNPKVSNYQIDLWFPSFEEAINFGVKKSYIEILED